MFAGSPPKIPVPGVHGTCPSCDADLPAGIRFCGACGAAVEKVATEQLTDAEALGVWLELDGDISPRPKVALLGVAGLLVVVAGAYVGFRVLHAPIVLGSVVARSTNDSPEAMGVAPSVVEMRVTPEALVSIDGHAGLQRSGGMDTLAAGVPHQMHFERPGFVAIDTTLTLRPGERRGLVVELRSQVVNVRAPRTATVKRAPPAAPGVVEVLVTPWAFVSIDRGHAFRRARGADTLSAGVPHRVLFKRAGFATLDTVLTLRPGEQRVLEIHLTPRTP